LTGSGAGKSGDTQFCGCRIGEDCGWVNSCRLSRLVGGELAKTLAAADTASVAVARALTSSVSDPDSDTDPDPGLGLIVLVAQPAF
jgi:hypothetical protein